MLIIALNMGRMLSAVVKLMDHTFISLIIHYSTNCPEIELENNKSTVCVIQNIIIDQV